MSKYITDDVGTFSINMMERFLMKILLMRKIMSKNVMINETNVKVYLNLKNSKVLQCNKSVLIV